MKAKIIIPSARFSNLKGCVESIFENEPEITKDSIIVVDDGAKADAPEEFPVTWVQGSKPFVFAKNINIGIAKTTGAVILMNDDTRLKTKSGFSNLASKAQASPEFGVISATVKGEVGNPQQHQWKGSRLRESAGSLAFVCIYVSRQAITKVGILDERFTAYGGDDMDYCARTQKNGLKLGIFDGCLVSHGEVPSTYRTRQDFNQLHETGLRQFNEKRKGL